ncbi:hypothetical protein HPB49_026595 [Dermacentor silvarum]|nr:hypothetical protein HPB49_026595 [Dermacentor silvarum]
MPAKLPAALQGWLGLSANIFNALTEKSKTMDAYSRHGGLVIDEIKLSEHLNVKSAGHIEGFGDLGIIHLLTRRMCWQTMAWLCCFSHLLHRSTEVRRSKPS